MQNDDGALPRRTSPQSTKNKGPLHIIIMLNTSTGAFYYANGYSLHCYGALAPLFFHISDMMLISTTSNISKIPVMTLVAEGTPFALRINRQRSCLFWHHKELLSRLFLWHLLYEAIAGPRISCASHAFNPSTHYPRSI